MVPSSKSNVHWPASRAASIHFDGMFGIGAVTRIISGEVRAHRLDNRLRRLRADAEREAATPVLNRHNGTVRFEQSQKLAEASLRLRLDESKDFKSRIAAIDNFCDYSIAEIEKAKGALSSMTASREQVAYLAIAVKVLSVEVEDHSAQTAKAMAGHNSQMTSVSARLTHETNKLSNELRTAESALDRISTTVTKINAELSFRTVDLEQLKGDLRTHAARLNWAFGVVVVLQIAIALWGLRVR
jgi:methyl-accepting chemotaxis protein